MEAGITTATTSDDSQRIVHAISDAILSGRLSPGIRLPEAWLQQEFGFSRSSIRRAFDKLRAMGVLSYEKNKGVQIAVPSQQQTIEIYQARKVIETGIIRLLVEQHLAGGLDMAFMEQLVAEEEQLFQNSQHLRLARKSCDFHQSIAAMCGNSFLHHALQPLIPLSTLAAATYGSADSGFCSYKEHRYLIAAIGSGDKVFAVMQMEEHLSHCVSTLDFDQAPVARGHFTHIFDL